MRVAPYRFLRAGCRAHMVPGDLRSRILPGRRADRAGAAEHSARTWARVTVRADRLRKRGPGGSLRGRKVRTVEGTPGGLILSYLPEGSADIGEVNVSASIPPFAGAARGYFNDGDLRAFAEAIDVYPLPPGARPELRTGLGEQETIGLAVSQVTSRGQLAVAIHLAVVDLDRYSPTSGTVFDARMLLLTSYQAVRDFAADLRSAVQAQGGTAFLRIEELS